MGPGLLRLYAGPDYASAWPILSVLCAFVLLHSLVGLQRAHLRAFANPAHTLVQEAAGAVANPLMIILLVPSLAGQGLAVARTVAAAALTLVGHGMLSLTMRVRYDGGALRTAFLASALMAAAILGMSAICKHPAMVLPASVAGVLAYVIGLRRRLTSDDIGLVLQLLPSGLARGRRSAASARWLTRFLSAEPVERASGP
jgi:O-antigen/teichoic acid export membrane protein